MEVKTKFKIGDKVYPIKQNSIYYKFERDIDCPVCNGKKHILINGYGFLCPLCMNNKDYKYCTEPLEILEVKIEFDKEDMSNPHISYLLDYDDYDVYNVFHHEKYCFSTLEEAKAECDKRNAELIKSHKVL